MAWAAAGPLEAVVRVDSAVGAGLVEKEGYSSPHPLRNLRTRIACTAHEQASLDGVSATSLPSLEDGCARGLEEHADAPYTRCTT